MLQYKRTIKKWTLRHLLLNIATPAKQGFAHHWKFSKVHTGPRFAQSFQPSVQKIMRINMFPVQDKVKPDRKYKRLKLGGGQAYDHSNY